MVSARAGQLLNQAKFLGSSAQRCHFLTDLGISHVAPLLLWLLVPRIGIITTASSCGDSNKKSSTQPDANGKG